MKYYSHHLNDYEKIYNKVLERLTRCETENLSTTNEEDRKLLGKPDKKKH